jgi:CheY-like chemotaxis protein
MTGLDVLTRLRSLYKKPRLPVILMTGSDVADDELRRAPADRLLQKPVLPEELVSHIIELMRTGGLAQRSVPHAPGPYASMLEHIGESRHQFHRAERLREQGRAAGV